MSELESNPGPIKCNHVKGAVAGVRLGRVSAQLPGPGPGRPGTVTNSTLIMMIHWGEIIHEIP